MRHTLAKTVRFEGVGLHTGAQSSLELRPAMDASGIIFHRADLPGMPSVAATLENVRSTVRGTNLAAGTCEVFTVEHVLSALFACGIDDAGIFLDGPEPPILDGSSLAFTERILEAGSHSYDAASAPELVLASPVEYSDGPVSYRAEPAQSLEYRFVYISSHPLVGRQEFGFVFSAQVYKDAIAPARTFGFEHEIDALRKAGLAKGGSEKNAVIITANGIVADGGLRFADEPVRHKVLDMVGDFSLLPVRPAKVKITAVCGGHAHNVKFARRLMEAVQKQ